MKTYHFSVRQRKIETRKGRPVKHQIDLHLAQLIHDEDDEDVLLIIYYAGHAIPASTTFRDLGIQ
jgi:hypothetical protein